MNYLDTKYINLLSHRLLKFKRKGPNLYNFRCPICGDSEKDQKKARGFIYPQKDKTYFYCHNCGKGLVFSNFLKKLDYALWTEYRLEKVSMDTVVLSEAAEEQAEEVKTFDALGQFQKLKKISQLPDSHPAKQWIVRRQIPNEWHSILRYTPTFKEFTNSVIPGKFSSTKYDEDRIIIPFINKNNKIHAFQGRSISPSIEKAYRYFMIVTDPTIPCIFGLNRIEKQKPVYCLEGPIDSMFLPNAIAIGGGNFADLKNTDIPKDKIVIIYDNEPRSKETKSKILHAIDDGYKVCVWPSSLQEKDVNDMITGKDHLTSKEIQYIIDKNTYHGFSAKIAVSEWSKV